MASEAARTSGPVTVAAPVSGVKTERGTAADNLGPASIELAETLWTVENLLRHTRLS